MTKTPSPTQPSPATVVSSSIGPLLVSIASWSNNIKIEFQSHRDHVTIGFHSLAYPFSMHLISFSHGRTTGICRYRRRMHACLHGRGRAFASHAALTSTIRQPSGRRPSVCPRHACRPKRLSGFGSSGNVCARRSNAS
jgi:hypothetical protein